MSYFQAYYVVVLTDQPLKAILQWPDTFGWLAKWTNKLNKFDIFYHPRSSMKAQILANFLDECIWSNNKPKEALAESLVKPLDVEMTWILHMDGISN